MAIEAFNFTRSRVDEAYFVWVGAIVLKKLGWSKNIEIRTRSLRSRNLVSSPCSEISLVFVGDSRMRALNKKYRGMDKTTDVLSFYYGGEKPRDIFGEIIISVPQAKRQAKRQSYPLKRELLALFVHGILHLAGYEDETERGYRKMMDKQEEILKSLI